MGAILEPNEAMQPWWSVEVRSESFHLAATFYVRANNRVYAGRGASTEEERAAAWYVDGGTLTAPDTPAALLAALDQVLQHPAYTRWRQDGGQPEDNDDSAVRAVARGDRIALHVPAHIYRQDSDGGYVADVELEYRHLAALRDAVAVLLGESVAHLLGADAAAVITARKRLEASASGVVSMAADVPDLTAVGTEELPAAMTALESAEYVDAEEDAARWVSRAFTATPQEAVRSGDSAMALCGAVGALRGDLEQLDEAVQRMRI